MTGEVKKPVTFVPGAMYGYCPKCGAPGEMRTRGPNGTDRCQRKHTYPSIEAVAAAHLAQHEGQDGKPVKSKLKKTNVRKLVARLVIVFALLFATADRSRAGAAEGELLLAARSAPAREYSCSDVRKFVAEHGKLAALAKAIEHGATPSQINEARKCLTRSKKS